MPAENHPGQPHPASGTEAPSDTAVPTGSAAPSENKANGPIPPFPLPGLPFSADPKRVLWWGGLAALAAVGVIEWPVAAVVGAGSYVAERLANEDAQRAARQQS